MKFIAVAFCGFFCCATSTFASKVSFINEWQGGGFETNHATTSDQQWLDKLEDYIDGEFNLDGTRELATGQVKMSWTYWSLNPNSGDTEGILSGDWTTVDTANAPISVAWTTNDGSAIAGTNYLAASGTLTFAVGENTKNISMTIPSQAFTGTKHFTVRLVTPSGAVLVDETATGTIERCPADDNLDGDVGGADLSLFLSNWGVPSVFDFNNDGTTNGADLTTLSQAWRQCQ